jgi:hypothetical protein
MTARRLTSVLAAGLLASATVVFAQPKQPAAPKAKTAPKAGKKTPTPLAPAKDRGSPATGSAASTDAAAGSAAGSAVQMVEDPPPRDATGTEENPEAPHTVADPDAGVVAAAPAPVRDPSSYPLEAAARPITLPQNMSEVALTPHAVVSPYTATTALRARYGVTPQVQLGLTYVIGGIFRDPGNANAGQAFHPGKAIGLDVTAMLQSWIGVSLGMPIYINPLAISIAIGAPIKFSFGDKFALGGLDDFLNIRVNRFAPTFYQELQNATNATTNVSNTIHSQGELRVSLYGIYQYQPNLAIILRAGIQMEDFASGKTDGCAGECLTNFLSGGISYSPRSFVDLGLSIGFDDLAHGGSFAPAGFLAVRI